MHLSSEVVWIWNGALRARILRFGATLQDLRLDPFPIPLVVSLDDAAYAGAQRALYSGFIVGCVAGRIAKGSTNGLVASVALLPNDGRIICRADQRGSPINFDRLKKTVRGPWRYHSIALMGRAGTLQL